MTIRIVSRVASAAVLVGALLVGGTANAATPAPSGGSGHPTPSSGHTLAPGTRLLTPPPDPGAVGQILDLARHRQLRDALLLGAMVATPQAVWLTKGTPSQVEGTVRQTMRLAAADACRARLRGL